MGKKPKAPKDPAELRRRAEQRLKELRPETVQARGDADTRRLVHEMQVHQIELEMQNKELEKARDELEAGMVRYSNLFDFAPVGYVTLDGQGTIREANLTAASLLAIERSRLVTQPLSNRVAATDRPAFDEFLQRVFASDAKEFCEINLLSEGNPPVAVRMEAVLAASGRECLAAMTDITGRKRAEEDRLILSKLQSTGILAGGIAHDFNNLLTVILLNLELAGMLIPPGERLAEILARAKQATLASRGLTQQLITFSSGGSANRRVISLSGVIRESARAALGASRVECDFALAGDLWPAEVDEGQIAQVIRNLVLNAREAMPDGGKVSVRAENVVGGLGENPPLPPGDHVRVTIGDEGIGIGREVQSKIFDPYFSTKQRGVQKGMGLGLTICHSIIQSHGGSISVASELGAGTVIQFHLPASRNLPEREQSSGPALPGKPGRILVMDDEEAVRGAVGMLIERMGHEVELVADGREALDSYRRAKNQGNSFDVVLMDLTVRGGMGGQEAMQALLEMDPDAKAIVMSGYADNPVVLDPERHGFKGVLAKPFNIVELKKVIDRVMSPGSDDQR
ncbi:MAG TPA: ATP-binding protein [Methylomirabilota bacterium]|nr:ATP-binding protein [Methylomirabilota bacterium]